MYGARAPLTSSAGDPRLLQPSPPRFPTATTRAKCARQRASSGAWGRNRDLFQERRDVDLVVGDLERRALAVVERDVAVAAGAARLLAARRAARAPLWSKPVAITVTRTSSPIESSITAPKMMFESLSAAAATISAASLTSNRPRSWPPVMLSRIPVAPSTDSSSSGEAIAAFAASTARVSPRAGADAHQRRAGVVHDRAHVGEVEVDQAGDRDEVGDALDALAQDVVGFAERLEDRRAALDDRRAASRSGSRSACRPARAGAGCPPRPVARAASPRTRTGA